MVGLKDTIWYTDNAGLSLRRKERRKKRKKAVPPPMKEQSLDNLWLAQMLFDLGAVQFGNFTVSESAVSSPVFVNPKVLISNPTALRVASKLMQQEISLAQSLRRPRVHPFGVVAGVPVGGLILACAYSLETNIPLIYVIVLIDREHGAAERLHHHGYNLISILKLDIMLNHYMSRGLISEETYRTCAEYLRAKQIENHSS